MYKLTGWVRRDADSAVTSEYTLMSRWAGSFPRFSLCQNEEMKPKGFLIGNICFDLLPLWLILMWVTIFYVTIFFSFIHK